MFSLDLAFLAASSADTQSRGSPANASLVVLWLPSRYLDLICKGPFPVYSHMLRPTPA